MKEAKKAENKTYFLNMLDFNSDYDRANPITDEVAIRKYLEKIEREAHDERLLMVRRQTMIHLERDTLVDYARRRTIVDMAQNYINHRVTSNMQAYNVTKYP